MDYFFAQVEERDDPSLKGFPVAIGGLYNGRGVLSTSNYEARKFGVRAAMPTLLALKKCPQLKLVNGHFDKYREASRLIFGVFAEFTDKVESISLDEAYVDVTDCRQFNNDAILIAKEIKRRIYERTKLTASAGVSFNKLLAKIGSDLFKPNGMAVLRNENIAHNIRHFNVNKIWGVGRVTAEKMNRYGIKTFGDLQKYTKLDLINLFGDFGASLHSYCRGVDNREVSTRGGRKSLSVEHTFETDYEKLDELLINLESCYEDLSARLVKHEDKFIKNIFVKIKYADFSSTTIEAPMNVEFESFKELFCKRHSQRTVDDEGISTAIRLLGVGVKFITYENKGQLELPLLDMN